MAIPAQAGPPNITGTWSCCGSGGAGEQNWIISSGTGSIKGVGKTPGARSKFATISGHLRGNQVEIVTTYTGEEPVYVATFKGTVSANGETMEGEWEGPGQSGTWIAERSGASPQYGQTVGAEVISGQVEIKPKGAAQFQPLSGEEQIPVGSIVDTSNGRMRLSSATGPNVAKAETAEFYDGTFAVLQPPHGRPSTELDLEGLQPGECRGGRNAARRSTRASATHNGLWGNGHGSYVTKGHAGSATVRGTVWLTEERCDGTFFEAKRDTVVVHDFTRHRTITLHTGQHYLAPAR
jgi:hypothetical protein